jgi:hypothetical protein
METTLRDDLRVDMGALAHLDLERMTLIANGCRRPGVRALSEFLTEIASRVKFSET